MSESNQIKEEGQLIQQLQLNQNVSIQSMSVEDSSNRILSDSIIMSQNRKFFEEIEGKGSPPAMIFNSDSLQLSISNQQQSPSPIAPNSKHFNEPILTFRRMEQADNPMGKKIGEFIEVDEQYSLSRQMVFSPNSQNRSIIRDTEEENKLVGVYVDIEEQNQNPASFDEEFNKSFGSVLNAARQIVALVQSQHVPNPEAINSVVQIVSETMRLSEILVVLPNKTDKKVKKIVEKLAQQKSTISKEPINHRRKGSKSDFKSSSNQHIKAPLNLSQENKSFGTSTQKDEFEENLIEVDKFKNTKLIEIKLIPQSPHKSAERSSMTRKNQAASKKKKTQEKDKSGTQKIPDKQVKDHSVRSTTQESRKLKTINSKPKQFSQDKKPNQKLSKTFSKIESQPKRLSPNTIEEKNLTDQEEDSMLLDEKDEISTQYVSPYKFYPSKQIRQKQLTPKKPKSNDLKQSSPKLTNQNEKSNQTYEYLKANSKTIFQDRITPYANPRKTDQRRYEREKMAVQPTFKNVFRKWKSKRCNSSINHGKNSQLQKQINFQAESSHAQRKVLKKDVEDQKRIIILKINKQLKDEDRKMSSEVNKFENKSNGDWCEQYLSKRPANQVIQQIYARIDHREQFSQVFIQHRTHLLLPYIVHCLQSYSYAIAKPFKRLRAWDEQLVKAAQNQGIYVPVYQLELVQKLISLLEKSFRHTREDQNIL